MTRALRFIGGCIVFISAMAAIWGWMVIGWAVAG